MYISQIVMWWILVTMLYVYKSDSDVMDSGDDAYVYKSDSDVMGSGDDALCI